MLENIAKNSNILIKTQSNEQENLLGELLKIKPKVRNFSFFEWSQKQGSIFSELHFNLKFDLKTTNKRNRGYITSNNFRTLVNTERLQRTTDKIKIKNPINTDSHQDLSLCLLATSISKNKKKPQVIHSYRNSNSFTSNKNKKVYHQRVFLNNQKLKTNKQLVREPGFVNLCFYKNTLELIQHKKNNRLVNRKKKSLKQLKRENTIKQNTKETIQKEKLLIKQHNYEYRPWSSKNQNEVVESDFPYPKQLTLKL